MVQYKFGKKPKRIDKRTLQFGKYLVSANLPSVAPSFDVDSAFTNMVDNNMYDNDTLGCCVIAGRGHCTLRLEDEQQGILIDITDSDIVTEYYKEEGCYPQGCDNGLDMLTSLNAWEKGWVVAGKTYAIAAYTEINIANHNELMYAVMLLYGAYTGLQVPQSAMDQFNAGQIWDVSTTNTQIVGGHCVYIVAYNDTGPICITWGKRQQMTWAFWDKYFDEAYAVIDNIDSWVNPATDPLNIPALLADVAAITGQPAPTPVSPPSPIPPPAPVPSPCPIGNSAAKISNFFPWVLHRKGRFYYMNPKKEDEQQP
jgi:hypothetical protein